MAINVPNIPYQPAPDVDPQGATPRLNVRADPDSFGANIGQAMRGLGGAMGQVGDELFSSAMTLQNTRNETAANDASTQFMIKGGEAAENFQLLQGKDPSDQLKAHLDSVNNMRQDARAAMPNDAARRMFDSQTLGAFRQYTIRSSAHAASQLQQYNKDSNKALTELAVEDVRKNASKMDEGQFWQGVERVKPNIANQFKGSSPEVIANETDKQTRRMLATYIKAKGDDNPALARDLLEKYRDRLDGDQYDALSKPIEAQFSQVAGRVAAERSAANPKGTGDSPAWNSNDAAAVGNAFSGLQQVARGYAKDNEDPDFHVLPGDGPKSFYITGDDVPGIQAAADKRGIPVILDKEDGRVRVSLPEEYDPSTTPKELPEEAASRAARTRAFLERKYPNIAKIGDVGEAKANSLHSKQKAADAETDRNNAKAVWNAMGDNTPKGEDELRERMKSMYNGNTQAWDDLPEQKRRQFLTMMERQDAKQDDIRERNNYMGMSAEELINTDPEEIMTNQKLTHGTKIKLLDRQQGFAKGVGQHPTVDMGMKLIQTSLPDYVRNDPETYKQFKAVYEDALMYELGDTHEKRVPPERMKDIGMSLLQNMVDPSKGKSFLSRIFSSEAAIFQAEPNAEQMAAARADPIWAKHDYIPGDEEVTSWWRMKQWAKLYGHKKPGQKGFFTGDEGIGEGSGVPQEAPAPEEKPAAAAPTEKPAPAVPTTSAYTGGRQTPEQITAGEEALEERRKAVGEAVTSARKATGEALRTGFGERKFKPEEATAARVKAAGEAEEARRVSDLATIDRQIKQLADDAKDLRGRDWTRPGDLDRELQHLARRRHDLEERRKGLVR